MSAIESAANASYAGTGRAAAASAREQLGQAIGFIVAGLDLVHAIDDPLGKCRTCREIAEAAA